MFYRVDNNRARRCILMFSILVRALFAGPGGCGEVLCQTNLNALGELEMCYDVYISGQSPFFSVTQLTTVRLSGRCAPALRSNSKQNQNPPPQQNSKLRCDAYGDMFGV